MIGKRLLPACMAMAALAGASAQQQTAPFDPTGAWLVAKRVAAIRIVNCDGRLWGVVAWEKYPGIDSYNPDPAKRGRPTLGMPVLLAMTQTKATEWSGQIYNSNDGHTYSATIELADPDLLRVRGCVFGFLCGGEDWSRITESATTGSPPHSSAEPAAEPWDPSLSPTATQSADDVCLAVLGPAGRPHERRLK